MSFADVGVSGCGGDNILDVCKFLAVKMRIDGGYGAIRDAVQLYFPGMVKPNTTTTHRAFSHTWASVCILLLQSGELRQTMTTNGDAVVSSPCTAGSGQCILLTTPDGDVVCQECGVVRENQVFMSQPDLCTPCVTAGMTQVPSKLQALQVKNDESESLAALLRETVERLSESGNSCWLLQRDPIMREWWEERLSHVLLQYMSTMVEVAVLAKSICVSVFRSEKLDCKYLVNNVYVALTAQMFAEHGNLILARRWADAFHKKYIDGGHNFLESMRINQDLVSIWQKLFAQQVPTQEKWQNWQEFFKYTCMEHFAINGSMMAKTWHFAEEYFLPAAPTTLKTTTDKLNQVQNMTQRSKTCTLDLANTIITQSIFKAIKDVQSNGNHALYDKDRFVYAANKASGWGKEVQWSALELEYRSAIARAAIAPAAIAPAAPSEPASITVQVKHQEIKCTKRGAAITFQYKRSMLKRQTLEAQVYQGN